MSSDQSQFRKTTAELLIQRDHRTTAYHGASPEPPPPPPLSVLSVNSTPHSLIKYNANGQRKLQPHHTTLHPNMAHIWELLNL